MVRVLEKINNINVIWALTAIAVLWQANPYLPETMIVDLNKLGFGVIFNITVLFIGMAVIFGTGLDVMFSLNRFGKLSVWLPPNVWAWTMAVFCMYLIGEPYGFLGLLILCFFVTLILTKQGIWRNLTVSVLGVVFCVVVTILLNFIYNSFLGIGADNEMSITVIEAILYIFCVFAAFVLVKKQKEKALLPVFFLLGTMVVFILEVAVLRFSPILSFYFSVLFGWGFLIGLTLLHWLAKEGQKRWLSLIQEWFFKSGRNLGFTLVVGGIVDLLLPL